MVTVPVGSSRRATSSWRRARQDVVDPGDVERLLHEAQVAAAGQAEARRFLLW